MAGRVVGDRPIQKNICELVFGLGNVPDKSDDTDSEVRYHCGAILCSQISDLDLSLPTESLRGFRVKPDASRVAQIASKPSQYGLFAKLQRSDFGSTAWNLKIFELLGPGSALRRYVGRVRTCLPKPSSSHKHDSMIINYWKHH